MSKYLDLRYEADGKYYFAAAEIEPGHCTGCAFDGASLKDAPCRDRFDTCAATEPGFIWIEVGPLLYKTLTMPEQED